MMKNLTISIQLTDENEKDLVKRWKDCLEISQLSQSDYSFETFLADILYEDGIDSFCYQWDIAPKVEIKK